MDRGDWQAAVHRVAKSQTLLKQLSTHAQMIICTVRYWWQLGSWTREWRQKVEEIKNVECWGRDR